MNKLETRTLASLFGNQKHKFQFSIKIKNYAIQWKKNNSPSIA